MTIIHSKPDLIAAIAKALNFPDYFAGNWDSFEECLAEFDFVEPPLYLILIFRHAETIFDLGKDSETLFSIFRDVSEEWTTSANERSLSVVLEGEADEKSEVILNSVGLKSL